MSLVLSKCLLLLLLLNLVTIAHSQQWPSKLSEDAQITLLTVSPGAELYSAFGHSALRVFDPQKHVDMVFNYGTFYFEPTFNFYWRFIKGRLNYRLSTYPYKRFLEEYQYYNRSVVQQFLELSDTQKNNIYRFLLNNNRPENRSYLYDFFYDNCSTRIRDIFELELKSDISFYPGNNTFHKTYRDLTREYTLTKPWIDLGITLILGHPADKLATSRGYMFLPDYLMLAFDSAVVMVDGEYIPFVKRKETVLEKKTKSMPMPSWFTQPTVILWAMLLPLLIISTRDFIQQRCTNWIDYATYSIAGIVGLCLSFCWFVTDHTVLSWNLNLLWAFPGHVVIALLMTNTGRKARLKPYFLYFSLLTILILLCWPWLPQPLPLALIPLITLLALRGIVIHRHFIAGTISG